MTIVAMAVYDTEENKKSDLSKRTIDSLFEKNQITDSCRLFIIDNNSCDETKKYLDSIKDKISLITLSENIGTARAINLAWKNRVTNENCIKMDNDVIINNCHDWIFQMERAISINPNIGIIGLKRKDCIERPEAGDFYKSELFFINKHGEPWICVEKVNHVMGTCQMYSSALLDKIGYLYQIGLYGFDDVFAARRSMAADFWNVFLPHIDIDHIDPGQTDHQKWKENFVGSIFYEAMQLATKYSNGEKHYYQEFY